MSLEDVREKKSSVGFYVVIGLLLVGMAGFGTSQFGTALGGGDNTALSVGDEKVSMRAFQDSLQANRQRYAELDDADVERLTFEQFRRQLALQNYVANYPLTVTDAVVDKAIVNNPAFFSNGIFSEEVFRRYVNVEPQLYRQSLAKDFSLTELQQKLAETAIVSKVELQPIIDLQGMTRDIVVAKLSRADYEQVATAEEVQAYYEKNASQFMSPEQVNIEYIEINPTEIAAAIVVSEDDVAQQVQAPRSVKYYLFANSEGAEGAVESHAGGTAFADMGDAIEDSGQLDSVAAVADADSPVPQVAIDAIFALNRVGQITAPIEIDGDVYLFELAEMPIQQRSAAQMQQAKVALQQQRAAVKIAELNEKLNNAYYGTNSADLESLSTATGLPVKQSGLMAVVAGDSGLMAVPELVEVLMAPDKPQGIVQEPVISGDRVIIYRVIDNVLPQQQSLDAVTDRIAAMVGTKKTDAALTVAAEQIIAAAKIDGLTQVAQQRGLALQSISGFTGRQQRNGGLDLLASINITQQTPVLGERSPQFVRGMEGDVFVYANTDVALGKKLSDAESQALSDSLTTNVGRTEVQQFVESVTSSAAIEVRESLLK